MNNTHEEAYHFTKILTVSCYCITFLVGIIGNGLVIWISGFRMKTVSAVWFLNLAIADFIFCLSLPIRVMDWLYISLYMGYEHKLYIILIVFNVIILAINSVVSVTFLTVISVHRCVSIMWPLWTKIHWTRRFATIASQLLWIVPLTCKLESNRFKKPKAFHRTFRLIIAVVVCFFICWFPFNIWPLLEIRLNIELSLTDFLISNICLFLISVSSCMNPILYVLLGHTRRTKSRKTIKARMENAINDFK
uniref:G-protein coupled receptors family 1 profile domain-containing protein n=1 Tax=Pyxicephalus adspersus TaxID=30357 RepID=A0AAV2ZGA1_PYXAD|nr:TPA: hypothetical protein GDO54_003286 [Pyxicephalus adspersus]